jgi:hypothetical protein
MTDDPRSQFVIAQSLIEEGRLDEARFLLMSIDTPLADAWLERIEMGLPVDVDAYIWEPHMAHPVRLPLPKLRPMMFLMSVFLAFSLFFPLLSPFINSNSRNVPVSTATPSTSSIALDRTRQYCHEAYTTAIRENRVRGQIISCMEWSFRLPRAYKNQVQQCHLIAENDTIAFNACLQMHEIIPPGVVRTNESE